MRVSCVTFLAAVALLANTAASAGQDDLANSPSFQARPRLYNVKQQITSTSRFLRVYDTVDEERAGGVPSSVIEKAKSMVTTVSAEKLAAWLNNGKSIDDVFTRMQLVKAGDKLFDNPQFLSWLNYADDLTSKTGKEVSTIATLTAHYGDDALAKILDAAKKVEATKGIATRLEVEQMQRWLAGGNSADDVFKLLKLDKAGDDVLISPLLDTWSTYMQIANKANPAKKATLYATLTAHYSDDALIRMIEAAMKVKSKEKTVKLLEGAQIQKWLANKQTPDDVFKLLKLDKAGDDVLISPLLDTWSTYMQIANKENPAKKATLFATLTAHYSDDALARMIEAAKKVKSRAKTVKLLEGAQIQTWLGNKQTPDDVFKLLKLDNAADDVLTSPVLNTWSNYLDMFNKENLDKKTTLIATLTTHYGDEGVARMLDAAKKVEATKTIATNLESAQIQHWLSSRKMPDRVFTLLNLDKAGDNLLASPLFTTFTKFTDAYHAKNLGSKMTTIWTVRTHYDDIAMTKMILKAEKNPSSASAAKRLEGVLFKDWTVPPPHIPEEPRSPDYSFELLKLNRVGIRKLLKDPTFNYWMKFMDHYVKTFPAMNIKRTMLVTSYKDKDLWRLIEATKKNPETKELGAKLEAETLKQFIFAKKEPLDVAKLMNVKENTDANWKLWKKYMQDYNKYHLRDITT